MPGASLRGSRGVCPGFRVQGLGLRGFRALGFGSDRFTFVEEEEEEEE